jgi:DNA-directed RNA polymerase subunit beta'
MPFNVEDFNAIRLRVASPEEILRWSHGEVIKPETINYRTQRPEKDGLMDERIFGPTKDWECYCGKYRRVRYKGIVCDKCGVEVTRAAVRRERFGHIALASPVCHIWFLRGIPSKLGLVLDISSNDLERIIYFAAYLVIDVHEDSRREALTELEREFNSKFKLEKSKEGKSKLKSIYLKTRDEIKSLKKYQILSELEYRRLSLKYGEVFEGETGAEAVLKAVSAITLKELEAELTAELKLNKQSNRTKLLKRLGLIKEMDKANIHPSWMFLKVLPVIPPDLRPMVQLDGGRYASSDLNDLYRRVINRNNRLKKLQELNAPEVIQRNEKRMLQESVDALIDNSARRGQGSMTTFGQRRQLRSLADMLKGKQGRFRQNLLGKRVDYSGRSVIVVGPELKFNQCGLPKRMALELFKPFVINQLLERGIVNNIRGASRLIEEGPDEVWAVLEDVIRERLVLLNRAPTLHRLSIQAFKPILIEGMAIQIHPMACRAFNADFDGDQMAVHVPLTEEAQAEAHNLILSTRNLLKPATGDPIVSPSQDMVLGCYWMTRFKKGAKGEGKVFSSKNEAVMAYQHNVTDINAAIKVYNSPKNRKQKSNDEKFTKMSVGRIIFNSALPKDYDFVNKEMTSKELEKLSSDLINHYGFAKASESLDKIKKLGFEHATLSGISWGVDDLQIPKVKKELVEKAISETEKTKEQYQQGLLTERESRAKIVEIWAGVNSRVSARVPESLPEYGSIHYIVTPHARASWNQINQMAAMKGLMRNPAGEIIELPIISSHKEGLKILEYFISTHGARKGTADTALKTAHAGYLTRRLVDVAQDIVVREKEVEWLLKTLSVDLLILQSVSAPSF